MRFIRNMINKIKSLFKGNNNVVNFKELELENLKKIISRSNNVVDLKASVTKMHLYMKKYKLTFESEEFKVLKGYVKIQKLKILSRALKKNNMI